MMTHHFSIPIATVDDTKVTYAQPRYEKIPIEVFMEISSLIVSTTECLSLAANLGFDGREIIQWRKSIQSKITNVAEEIFLSWNASTAASRERMQSILGKALLEIGRRDLYDIFSRKCDSLTAQ